MGKFLLKMKSILPRSLFLFLQTPYHFIFSLAGGLWYGFPCRKLTIIGVTGTKGKTTVVELLHQILDSAGFKTASVSTLRFKIGEEEEKNEYKMTLPGRAFLQKFLWRALKAGCTHAVIEVTSEGIRQFRHRFIVFDAAVMTNVAPEHLESHGGFENYLRAKLDLFWRLPFFAFAVINKDDPCGQRFASATSGKKIFYGKNGIKFNGKEYPIRDLEIDEKGITFDLGPHLVKSSLLGEFNFYNILAAIAAALSLHLDWGRITAGVEKMAGVPGRLEYIKREPFSVVIDYAHTPDSLEVVYNDLKKLHSNLICVLGAAGGGRDRWKRKEFGKIASLHCKNIILTNEDPYDENPEFIVNDVASGIPQNITYSKEMDRRKAMRRAFELASPGDVVIITGKGAEPWIMGPNGEKIPWDDRQVASEELKLL